MNEKLIKEMALKAGFAVAQNMQGPVDVVCGKAVQARSVTCNSLTLERFTQWLANDSHFSMYEITGPYARFALFTPTGEE